MRHDNAKTIIRKRVFDIVVLIILLPVVIFLMVLIAITVKLAIGSPIFFRQDRPGLDGKIFTLVKFRTMLDSKNKNGELLPNEDRFTKFGDFLRSTSLDELPELWNIITGDMSLVGPRPLLVEYLNYYSEKQKKRHSLLPGITGLAQISGRNTLDWEDRFKLDVWYVENRTLSLDIKILFLTLAKVLKSEGVNPDQSKVMPAFRGKSNQNKK